MGVHHMFFGFSCVAFGVILVVYCDVCSEQKEKFSVNDLNKFIEESTFNNESKHAIKMAWIGQDPKKILVVTTEPVNSWLFTAAPSSDIYLSKDDGRSFAKITERVGKPGEVFIQTNFGLFVNPHNLSKIVLVGYSKSNGAPDSLFLTFDAAESWSRIPLSFIPNGPILFHPNVSQQDNLLLLDSMATLHLSRDGGRTWTAILKHVKEAGWTTNPHDHPGSIYVLHDDKNRFMSLLDIFSDFFMRHLPMNALKKTSDFGSTWVNLQDHVFSFSMKGKFLYASIVDDKKDYERHLRVSTNGGNHFTRVQLPTITPDQFYSVIDMEDDLVFLHVDNAEAGIGKGTLYTSDTTGVFFSESLRNHLYMGDGGIASDFYRVNSLRATFITTRIRDDNTLQTLITFNRGAEWRPLRRPEDSDCVEPSKTCELQISNGYSRSSNVLTQLPLSVNNALGVILAHGHVASSLKNTPPDVFISRDGGYNWKKVLDGPHYYQIGDQGGLLVAVPATASPEEVKFSTDQGECWHSVRFFTNSDIQKKLALQFTGIVTEPGNKAMTIAIWGYSTSDRRWYVHILDFARLISRECDIGDYELWYPHGEMTHPNGEEFKGCLLGRKEVFKRIKAGSLCRNGNTQEETSLHDEKCPCTKDDYECEYGYHRKENSSDCVRNPFVNELDICIDGNEEIIVTQGYRKIPGDICEGGSFKPDKRSQKMLNKTCSDDDNMFVVEKAEIEKDKNDATSTPVPKPLAQNIPFASHNMVIILSLCISVLAIGLIWALLLIGRRRMLNTSRGRQGVLHYHLLDDNNLSRSEDGMNGVPATGSSHESSKRRNPQLSNGNVVAVSANGDAPLIKDANETDASRSDTSLLEYHHQLANGRENAEDVSLLDDDEAALIP